MFRFHTSEAVQIAEAWLKEYAFVGYTDEYVRSHAEDLIGNILMAIHDDHEHPERNTE